MEIDLIVGLYWKESLKDPVPDRSRKDFTTDKDACDERSSAEEEGDDLQYQFQSSDESIGVLGWKSLQSMYHTKWWDSDLKKFCDKRCCPINGFCE